MSTEKNPARVQPVAPRGSGPGPFDRMRKYLNEVMAELKKTTWPSREETRAQTQLVIALLIVVGVFIFVWDNILGLLFRGLLHLMGVNVGA